MKAIEYKKLNKYDKLKEIQKINFCSVERHTVAKYLFALWKEDNDTIQHYESFGDNPRQIIMNKRGYDQNRKFGFSDIVFNKYGWLESPDFLDVEQIQLPHRENWAIMNYITIGRGLNNKWSYGLSYSYNTGGGGYGLSVWGKIFSTRKECLIYALEDINTRLIDSKDSSKYTITVIKQIKEQLNTLKGKVAVQLSLF